jgi:hypothetical protein
MPQICRDRRELLQRALEVVGYLLGYDVGILEFGGVLKTQNGWLWYQQRFDAHPQFLRTVSAQQRMRSLAA